jgi:hypothetical protein
LFFTSFWILAAGIVGLITSALFAGKMKLRRHVFLVPYVTISSLFLLGFFYWNSISLFDLIIENWIYGLSGGLVVGLLLAKNVFSQSSSEETIERNWIFDISWLGIVYGVIDALLLNVMPIIVVWNGFDQIGLLSTWSWQIIAGLLGLGASLLVTLLYHIGYPEFRNKNVGLVLIGNTIISLAYLISTNPLGAILSHTMMHIAAVVKGPETTIQLPPHYF